MYQAYAEILGPSRFLSTLWLGGNGILSKKVNWAFRLRHVMSALSAHFNHQRRMYSRPLSVFTTKFVSFRSSVNFKLPLTTLQKSVAG